MATAQDEALELQHAMSLLSPQEREAMGLSDGADELELLNELQDNGDTERQVISELPPAKDKAPEPDDATEDDDKAPVTNEQAALDQKAKEEADAAKAAEEAAAAEAAEAAKAEEAETQAVDEGKATPVTDGTDDEWPDFGKIAPAVENYDDKVAAVFSERDDAHTKWIEGELSSEEYKEIDRRTLTELNSLNAQQNRHLDSAARNQEAIDSYCDKQIRMVKAQAKEEGIDYENDPKFGPAWDRWIRALGSDPENNNKSYGWFLKEAHKLVKLQYNFPDAVQNQLQTSQAKPDATPPKAEAPRPRTPDLSNIPPTLSNAPAAAIESEGEGGEFAYLDKLTGIARERALARLTPDQEARYLEG